MSKGLTVIAFVFLLPFVIIGTLWMASRKRGTAVVAAVSPGSAQGTSPQGTTRPASSSAQGNAPGGSGAADVINATAAALKAAQPILQGALDAWVNSNDDYETDNSEANVAADQPIDVPFWQSVTVF